ncbi:hypothetical protein C8Q80DRAFT_1354396 [Daedaleopsis nitida]|nr:hypothetical protein C8Q80DRAFT_1354396 [Daedaleopsis nitida]
MPSFRCSICLDMMGNLAKPMTTTCGHIYCLDCATFHFTASPSCAVCRKNQTLQAMIRLYPDWEADETRQNAFSSLQDESVSSSPTSVQSMDRAADEAITAAKQAIADRVDTEDALMVCNTFVNSVTGREKALINTDLLREISFQLTLLTTKIKDDHTRLEKLTKNAKSARSSEKRLSAQLEQQRSTTDALEKANARLSSQVESLQEQVATLEHQCRMSAQDGQRQRVRAGNLEGRLEDAVRELDTWKQQALRAKKKYLALKSKVEDAKRAAFDADRGRVRDKSDDLIVV